jgi:hypothetical protein
MGGERDKYIRQQGLDTDVEQVARALERTPVAWDTLVRMTNVTCIVL